MTPEIRNAGDDMDVSVDQAGHQSAAGEVDAVGGCGADRRVADFLDAAVLDENVDAVAECGFARIEQPAAGEEERCHASGLRFVAVDAACAVRRQVTVLQVS